MDRDQPTSGRSAHPLPECLTQLLIDPKERIKPEPVGDPKPSLFDGALWWLSVAISGAIALIFGAALKIAELWP